MIVSGPQKTAESINLDKSLDESFVYQKYVFRDAIDLNHQRINSPKLTGLSGGLTYDLGNPIDPKVLDGGNEFVPHPVGICTKYDSEKQVIRSSRPGVFIRDFLESGEFLEC